MRLLVTIALATVSLAASPRARSLGVGLRPLRDPGRCLVDPRPWHAGRAPGQTRGPGRRSRPLQPALEPDRADAWRARTGRRAMRCSVGCGTGGSQPSSASSARRAGATGAGRRTSRRRRADFAAFARAAAQRVPLGPRLARLERAEPGPLAPADVACPLRPVAAQSGVCGDPRREPPSTRRRRRHRTSRGSNGVSPVTWIRGMKAAGARLDAYAHHPYPARPTDTPFAGGCAQATCRDDHDGDARAPARGDAESVRVEADLADRVRLPDRPLRCLGAPPGRADRPVRPAGRPRAPRRHADPLSRPRRAATVALPERAAEAVRGGEAAAAAFAFPLAFAGRSGGKAVLWGQVRPRSGPQTYRLQIRTGGWSWAGPNRRTSARGFLSASVAAPRGTLVRIWSPRDRVYSAPIVVR